MKKYYAFFTALIVFLFIRAELYAENDNIINYLTKNIRVNNTRCLTLHGDEGALSIFLEKKKLNNYVSGKIYIYYNGNEIGFHADNNFVITKDDDLVFVKNGKEVYAKIDNKKFKDPLTIKVCTYFKIKYDKQNLIIENGSNTIKAKEVLFNRSKMELYILKNGKEIKTIKVIDCRE